jgi:hypothetical protein
MTATSSSVPVVYNTYATCILHCRYIMTYDCNRSYYIWDGQGKCELLASQGRRQTCKQDQTPRWEHSHLSVAFHHRAKDRQKQQYRGLAMWSLGKVAHRIIGKSQDEKGLGRWTWTRYRGQGCTSLKIIAAAYRPVQP